MKYLFFQLKDIFFKKVVKFCFLELFLILVYLKINDIDMDYTIIFFDLNKFVFYDQMRDLIKIIDITLIIYSSIVLFFYDLNRSIEFFVLREKNKSYIVKKLIIIFIYILLYKIILYFIMILLFSKFSETNMLLLIKGLLNVILYSLLSISLINLLSNHRYLLLSFVFFVFIYNLIFSINNFLILFVAIIILSILNYHCYSTQKVYNRFVK